MWKRILTGQWHLFKGDVNMDKKWTGALMLGFCEKGYLLDIIFFHLSVVKELIRRRSSLLFRDTKKIQNKMRNVH